MRKLLLFMAAVVFVACGRNSGSKVAETALPSDGVEVLSFHTKNRCPTCIAIEKLAREIVETDFAAQLAEGRLVFRVVDISDDEALADRYEITWSALFVNRYKDGKQCVNDLTKFAFANARTNPEKFKSELKAEIQNQLDR